MKLIEKGKKRREKRIRHEKTEKLTEGKIRLLDDPFERVVDQLAVNKEPQIAIDGGVPLGHGPLLWLLDVLLALFGLLFGVQLHRHKPHLLHKSLGLTRVPLPGLLGRRRGHNHSLQRHLRCSAMKLKVANLLQGETGIRTREKRGYLDVGFGEIRLGLGNLGKRSHGGRVHGSFGVKKTLMATL